MMPNQDGLLKADEKAEIQKFLETKGLNPCVACGTAKGWMLTEHVLNMPIFTPGEFRVGGPSYPLVMILCNHCYHARFYPLVAVTGAGQKATEEKKDA